ncbi:MAG: hypothetical protein WCS96_13415 [Victivallales bacterium]|jgi:hypothetical protein
MMKKQQSSVAEVQAGLSSLSGSLRIQSAHPASGTTSLKSE